MDVELWSCGYAYHTKPFRQRIEQLPYFLFRLQTEGFSRALVNGKMQSLEPGDLLLFQPGEQYDLRVNLEGSEGEGSGDYFLFCQGSWVKQWWGRSEKPQCVRIDLDERILFLWRQLHLEKHRVQEVEPELLTYLVGALCVSLERAVVGTASLHRQSDLHAKFTSDRMKRYIETHAMEDLRVEDVANHVQRSVSRAAHLFKETFGLTIVQYALEIKLSHVVDRIRYTNMNLEQVAESCGFGSYSYFHKVFKKKYGMSPNDFRQSPMDYLGVYEEAGNRHLADV